MRWGPEQPRELWRANGEDPGLSALMDKLPGGHIARPLALAGPAAGKVAEAMDSPETGQSFLAGLFWWLFAQSEGYSDAAKRLRASRSARPVVVCHAHGTRFDLLLLDDRRRRRSRAVQLERAQTYAGRASHPSLWRQLVWRTLTIDGSPAEIVQRHKPSDSCLVRVSKSIMDDHQRYGLKGPLKKAPRLNAAAFFDGALSGPTPALIIASDLAIMDPRPEEMCRVYTEPATVPGDSGAALIDEDDYIVGFAHTRSGYGSRARFSAWVWAEQVYMAHKLLSRVAVGA